MECSSTDSSRHVLNGACLDVSRPDSHYVVATDGRQLYAANSFSFDLPRSIILPARKFLAWPGFSEESAWKLRTQLEAEEKDGGWIEFRSDRWTFVTRAIGGPYPNWRQIFPIDTAGLTTVELAPDAVQTLLDAVPRVHTRQPNHDPACFCARSGGLFLMGRASQEAPWTELPVPGAQVAGVGGTALLNKEQLLSALRMGFSQMEVRDPLTPVVMRGNGKQMALGVVRGDTPPPTPAPATTTTQRNPMNTTIPATDRTKAPAATPEPESPLRAAMAQVEALRSAYRESLNGLNQGMTLLKAAERDQRSSEKEIDSVRSTLRSLQRVQI